MSMQKRIAQIQHLRGNRRYLRFKRWQVQHGLELVNF